MFKPVWLIPVVAVVVMACSSDGSEEDDSSATCEDWKDAYCSWLNECGVSSYAECESNVVTLECAHNAPLFRCVDELSQGCDSAPDNCDAKDVADSYVAQVQCQHLINAFCSSVNMCDPSQDRTACENSAKFQLDCDSAYAVSANYDSCMVELRDGTCEISLPSLCEGVILTQ